ncbi:MAG TPA: type III pantothenate kinase, partial [bacterium]|nr:type III pantothenate kinase [bacterium]
MLLTIDIGNTNIVLGLFEGEDLVTTARISTSHHRTVDEYGTLIQSILETKLRHKVRIDGVSISSVVPELAGTFKAFSLEWLHRDPLLVGPGIKTGLAIRYDDPRKVGADRIVNAVAGTHYYGTPLILVDFGTAVTFCAVSRGGEYLGGAIFPGIRIAYDALFARTAQLPRIPYARPARVIGQSTTESLQSGAINGYGSLVDGMVAKYRAEMREPQARVIGTGGLAGLVAGASESIEVIDEHLTLKGLRLLYL